MEKEQYCYKYPHPAVTTDCVIFGFDGSELRVLLIERGLEPFCGQWALPGGFVKPNETLEECARRELREETGLESAAMRQFRAFSEPGRDPRPYERVITVAFYALVKLADVEGGDDARRAQWFTLAEAKKMPLAFDHSEILRAAIGALSESIYLHPVGFDLLPEHFTISQLQKLYEAILGLRDAGESFDRRNFYKRMQALGVIERVGERADDAPRREAVVYRFNPERYAEQIARRYRQVF